MKATEARTRCRALVAGFGRPGMRDLDIGRHLVRYLEGLSWNEEVIVEDLSYAAPLVLHRLQELEPAKVVLVGGVARGFDTPGSIRRYQLDVQPPSAEDVQRSLEESVQGVVDIDHTLAVARHYGALPLETVVIEVEPADCSFGVGFSEDLLSAFDMMVALVQDELGDARDLVGSREIDHDLLDREDAPARTDTTPSRDLEALIRYAGHHEESRVVGRHRGPQVLAASPGGGALAAVGRSKPWGMNLRGAVGSDWFDVVPLEDGWWGCVVGDVAGRGVEATPSMAELRAAVRAYAIPDGRSPGRVLDSLDRLARAIGLGADATLVYIAFCPATGELRLANAGSHPPLLRTKDGDTEFVRAALGGPVGSTSQLDPRQDACVVVPAGSTIVVFTDGLVETSRHSTPAGLERLRQTVSTGPIELDALCDHVFEVCAPHGIPEDDVCMLAFRSLETDCPTRG